MTCWACNGKVDCGWVVCEGEFGWWVGVTVFDGFNLGVTNKYKDCPPCVMTLISWKQIEC